MPGLPRENRIKNEKKVSPETLLHDSDKNTYYQKNVSEVESCVINRNSSKIELGLRYAAKRKNRDGEKVQKYRETSEEKNNVYIVIIIYYIV